LYKLSVLKMTDLNRKLVRQIISTIARELKVDAQVVLSNFKKSIEEEKDDSCKNMCSYEYQRGDKKKQRCSFKSKEGSSFCSRHCTKQDKKKEKNVNKKTETIKNITKLMRNKPTLEICKNKFNNYETPNKLLYDIENKEIYGFQNADGTLRDLTKNEIEWCKEHNLRFKYPFNLSLEKTNLPDSELQEDTCNDFEEDDDLYEDEDEYVEDDDGDDY